MFHSIKDEGLLGDNQVIGVVDLDKVFQVTKLSCDGSVYLDSFDFSEYLKNRDIKLESYRIKIDFISGLSTFYRFSHDESLSKAMTDISSKLSDYKGE